MYDSGLYYIEWKGWWFWHQLREEGRPRLIDTILWFDRTLTFDTKDSARAYLIRCQEREEKLASGRRVVFDTHHDAPRPGD